MKKDLVIYMVLMLLSSLIFSIEEMAKWGAAFLYTVGIYTLSCFIADKVFTKKSEEEDLPF